MNVFYAKSVLLCDGIVAVLRVPSQRGKGRWRLYPGGDRIVAVLRVPSRRGKGVLAAVSPGRQDCGAAESPVAEVPK